MQDEGFHEIQLNGKQLVFLFMAGTVVAVVIFLCGVMVGRGVPERTLVAGAATAAPLDPTAALPPPSSSTASTDDNQPLTAGETLTYPSLLENPDPPAETLAPTAEPAIATAPKPAAAAAPEPMPLPAPMPKPAAPKPAPVAAAPVAAAPKPATPAPKPAPLTPPVAAAAASSLNEPAGSGFVVQVAAVRQRAEADRIAQRLTGKGYPAFVTTSGANFRVRVGKFDDRRQAETVAGRLEREEQFKPWITR
jgi:DedD protein